MRCVVAATAVAGALASSPAFVAPTNHGRPRTFLSVPEVQQQVLPEGGSSVVLLAATESAPQNAAGSVSSVGMYCFAAFAALSAASSYRQRGRRMLNGKRARSAIALRAEGDDVEAPAEPEDAAADSAAEEPVAEAAAPDDEEAPAEKEEDTGPGSLAWLKAQTGDYQMAWRDYKNKEKNYVNPWEQRVKGDTTLQLGTDDDQRSAKPIPSGQAYHPYHGPVYKQVPVYEGVQFPLDPKLYYPPLEPPPPGAKWGDGRSPDGNWYMDIEGKQVQYWQGVGRRKTACAIVRILKGDGQFIVNGQDAIEYFQGYPIHWLKAIEPLAALSAKNDYDCLCKAFGGGKSGQAGAIRLGVARAMQELNFEWRPLLKKSKYLTRDWRTVESKKVGKHKARKSKPYHKR